MSSRGDGRSGIAGSGIGPLSLVTGVKKFFQDVSESPTKRRPLSRAMLICSQDVLYLMIVQRPTDEQMAAAMQRMSSMRHRT